MPSLENKLKRIFSRVNRVRSVLQQEHLKNLYREKIEYRIWNKEYGMWSMEYGI